MSDAKHTPGEWHLSPGEKPNALGTWTVFHGGGERPDNQVCAAKTLPDARLIVASKGLLYALQAFVDYFTQAGIGPCLDGHDDDEDDSTFNADARFNVRLGRAAIAKATA